MNYSKVNNKNLGYSFITITNRGIRENEPLNKRLLGHGVYKKPLDLNLKDELCLSIFSAMFALVEALSNQKLGIQKDKSDPFWGVINLVEESPKWLKSHKEVANYHFILLRAKMPDDKSLLTNSKELELLVTDDEKMKNAFFLVTKKEGIFSINDYQLEKIADCLARNYKYALQTLESDTKFSYASRNNLFNRYIIVSRKTGMQVCQKNIDKTNDPLFIAGLTMAFSLQLKEDPLAQRSIGLLDALGNMKRISNTSILNLKGISILRGSKSYLNTYLIESKHFLAILYSHEYRDIKPEKWKKALDLAYDRLMKENIDVHSGLIDEDLALGIIDSILANIEKIIFENHSLLDE